MEKLSEYILYILAFPQLIAGPIVRFNTIADQITNRTETLDDKLFGLFRFCIGLAKKMLIANSLGIQADAIMNLDPNSLSTTAAWVGILAYTFQLYFDFSAYSDMAIGLAKMLGFNFLENFNYPYIANSIKDFWRRWHISLSTWFRDYLYIPLGGNRTSSSLMYRNLFIVFFATGLWHGASWNFIIWGLMHGLFLVAEKLFLEKTLSKLWKPIGHIYTLLIVMIGWVFFRSEDLPYAIEFLEKMFFLKPDGDQIVYTLNHFVNKQTIVVGILGIVFSLPVFPYFQNIFKNISNRNLINVPYYIGLVVLLYIVMMYLSVETYNPFIYFRF